MNKEKNRDLNDTRNQRFVDQRFFENKPIVFQQRKFEDLEAYKNPKKDTRKETYINNYYQIKKANVQNDKVCVGREGFLDNFEKLQQEKNELIQQSKAIPSFREYLELKRKGLLEKL